MVASCIIGCARVDDRQSVPVDAWWVVQCLGSKDRIGRVACSQGGMEGFSALKTGAGCSKPRMGFYSCITDIETLSQSESSCSVWLHFWRTTLSASVPVTSLSGTALPPSLVSTSTMTLAHLSTSPG